VPRRTDTCDARGGLRADTHATRHVYHQREYSLKTDGVILGKVKNSETDREVTSRNRLTGKILPFAQREMVRKAFESES
jgi:hypothetical protein